MGASTKFNKQLTSAWNIKQTKNGGHHGKMFQHLFTNQHHAHYQNFGQITKFYRMFILGLFVHKPSDTTKMHANLPFTVAVNNLPKNVNSVCTECVVKKRCETGNGGMCC